MPPTPTPDAAPTPDPNRADFQPHAPALRARVLDAIAAGTHPRDAAREAGVSEASAYRWLRAARRAEPTSKAPGAPTTPPGRKPGRKASGIAAPLRARALALLAAGKSVQTTAAEVGLSTSTICRWRTAEYEARVALATAKGEAPPTNPSRIKNPRRSSARVQATRTSPQAAPPTLPTTPPVSPVVRRIEASAPLPDVLAQVGVLLAPLAVDRVVFDRAPDGTFAVTYRIEHTLTLGARRG